MLRIADRNVRVPVNGRAGFPTRGNCKWESGFSYPRNRHLYEFAFKLLHIAVQFQLLMDYGFRISSVSALNSRSKVR